MSGAWRPDRFAERRQALAARAGILAAVRGWFAEEGLVEVDTPALQVSPGLEPHLAAFATDLQGPHPHDHARLYLHTSPEFAMKKLLAAGVPALFQMGHVFRNGERSATHHPEFTMLEWYRAGVPLDRLVADCAGLFAAVAGAARAAGFDGQFHWQGRAADPLAEPEVLSVADAFQCHAGIDLMATMADPHAPDAAALARAAYGIGIKCRADDGWEDVFFRIFLERIEPNLGLGRPTVLTHYPASMAALARVNADDHRVADRFEVFVCGLELANAFGELTDAMEQRRRFAADQEVKERLYGTRYPVDPDFLAALDHGLPPSAGIALGLDRLVMLATAAARIDDVLWLPVADPAADGTASTAPHPMPLHPEAEALLRRVFLAGKAQSPPPMALQTGAYARELNRLLLLEIAAGGEGFPHGQALTLPSPAGDMPARLFSPPGAGPSTPWTLYFFGGGYVIGGLDEGSIEAERIAQACGCHVVMPAYRLAPENPFPAAIEDAWAAFRWLVGHAAGAPLAVAGHSAGGGLAAATLRRAADAGIPVAAGYLVCPWLEMTEQRQSHRFYGSGFGLDVAGLAWCREKYVTPADYGHPWVSPVRHAPPDGHAPTVVLVGGCDVLRDEAVAYADRLRRAGIFADLVEAPGMPHGFPSYDRVLAAGRPFTREADALFARRLAAARSE
ncbi:MAG: EF-P lysine aminoacylase GenX [Rhodospirillaceae bacterium]|nr:EF-P lysine aminoacylase GenX [Rhodospirillaceae bacterium]